MWGVRERGHTDERSIRDLASALMLRPPSPAVSRFRRESKVRGGLRGGAHSEDLEGKMAKKELRFRVQNTCVLVLL